jgi:hypothetical protein
LGTISHVLNVGTTLVDGSLSDKEFCQIEENHADYSFPRKCFESGNCKG